MRPRIYPDTEDFINAKITAKLAKMGDETNTSTMNQGSNKSPRFYVSSNRCKAYTICSTNVQTSAMHNQYKIHVLLELLVVDSSKDLVFLYLVSFFLKKLMSKQFALLLLPHRITRHIIVALFDLRLGGLIAKIIK
ncbi:uncharacterized protein EV154DRAFT_486259 [Mucor mucedo]|uniref:uncharacterized protein n=1 Tax=Mucor mucedo TaxID=29922 RepID=UPI00221FB723|nr:uncharacterized protein EV154DRAFT_486259 [Mucor mucedo]KAI7878130.1 hypothetical protein EV154DRAFT_486259 [Mucor mucedo]